MEKKIFLYLDEFLATGLKRRPKLWNRFRVYHVTRCAVQILEKVYVFLAI